MHFRKCPDLKIQWFYWTVGREEHRAQFLTLGTNDTSQIILHCGDCPAPSRIPGLCPLGDFTLPTIQVMTIENVSRHHLTFSGRQNPAPAPCPTKLKIIDINCSIQCLESHFKKVTTKLEKYPLKRAMITLKHLLNLYNM